MNKKIMKYNPAFLEDEELIQSFVVRHPEFEIILGIIKENTGASNQHILVLGTRGIGKTTLARRVAIEIHKKPEDYANWHSIIFGEESYQVSTPGEFWLEAIFHIAEQTQELRWKNTYQELHSEPDETRLKERALAQLMDFADEKNKRLLLIVENLNMIFGQQFNKNGEDAWVLRHTLTNEPRIMLLGTAVSRFKEVADYDKAMYDLFREVELHPLDDEDCIRLWEFITDNKLSMKRIRPIKILTGGNPRLLNIISTFAANSSFRELMENLTHLVDEHTEYFKSHLDRFSALDRKVFAALADLWDPSTARNVAKAARIDVNKTSTLLGRLVERGAVEVVDQKGKSKWYQVAERMYNIYHLMRRRGQPSDRVRAVVRFMVIFYEGQELVKVAHSLVSEACKIKSEYRRDHYLAYESILKEKLDKTTKKRILEHSRSLLEDLPDTPESLKKLFTDFDEIEKIDHYNSILKKLKQWDELEDDSEIIRSTEKEYRHKITKEPENADFWFLLGVLLKKQSGKYEEAALAFNKAIKINPKHSLAFAEIGELLHKHLNRYEDAESAYRNAVELEPNDHHSVWERLGTLLYEKLEKYDEATTALKKAIEIEDDCGSVWAHYGELLHTKLNRYKEAEAAYRKAVELEPNYAWAWAQLGQLLDEELNRFEEAEFAYKKAIELEPEVPIGWVQLGVLLHQKLNRFTEAEEAYRNALKLIPNDHFVWTRLAELLFEDLKKYDEAEQAIEMAIETQPGCPYCWLMLIKLKLRSSRPAEVLKFINSSSNVNEQNAMKISAIAGALYESRNPELLPSAEKWAKMALEKEPENAIVLHTLASILTARNKCEEALEVSKHFLKHAEMSDEVIGETMELYINLAATSCAEEAIEQIKSSKHTESLEPLIAGMQLYLGQKVETAQEIQEIGKDVAKRIEEKKLAFLNNGRKT